MKHEQQRNATLAPRGNRIHWQFLYVLATFILSTQCVGLALASEQGYTAFDCIEIESSLFAKEASGVGSSCALIGRKTNAENRAEDALVNDAEAECDDVDNSNPEFFAAYCQLVCEYHGYEESNGINMCSFSVTDTDSWEEDGCFTGDRQYHRMEADVQCGCSCSTRL
jgi:hypothetical protein